MGTTKYDVEDVIISLNVKCDFTPEELTERDLRLFNFAYGKGREWGNMGNCLSDHKDWLIDAYNKLNL